MTRLPPPGSTSSHLLALLDTPFPSDEGEAVRAGKTLYERFDRNVYIVPYTQVHQLLKVRHLDSYDP